MKRYRSFCLGLSALMLGTSVFTSNAVAEECFQFQELNSPAAINSHLLNLSLEKTVRTWCYQKEKVGAQDVLLVFNTDAGELKPELSALVYLDLNEEIKSISVASRILGKIKFHSFSDPSLNPFPVPLSLNDARMIGQASFLDSKVDPEALENLILQHVTQTVPGSPILIKAGDFSGVVSEKSLSFNGFWWSHEGLPMSTGPNSPLGIYDASIAARTGTNPNSIAWESANHSDTSTSWGGHCNGWAASSILNAEPISTLYDPLTHTMVTPYAQKGMLAEAAYCVDEAFYGNRYSGPADDIHDIYPDLFHKVLVHYIGSTGKPVAMDYERGVEVDNNVIEGYQFHIIKMAASQSTQTFHVDATLTVAQYDIEQRDSLGTAGTYQKTYAYTLVTDPSGNILSGAWDQTSDNPDFLWVPLALSENCSPRNPAITPGKISALLNSLTPAKKNSKTLNFVANTKLIPQGQIPIPLLIEAGDQMKLQVNVKTLTPTSNNSELKLIVSGNSRYPVTGGEKESMFISLKIGSSEIALDQLLSIDSIAIVNQSTTVTSTVNLTIPSFTDLSP